MKTFISHSHAQAVDADRLALALRNASHDALLDRDLLGPAEEYHARLRTALQSVDLFVFLITPDAVRPGCFALSEVDFARQRWQRPAGRVLPVMWQPTDMAQVPEYLKSVNIVQPKGNAVTETVAAVDSMAATRRWRRQRQTAAVVAVVAGVAAAGWLLRRPPPPEPLCLLRATVLPLPTQSTTVEAGRPGALRPFVVGATDGVAQVDIRGLTADDKGWSIATIGIDGQPIARFELLGCPRQAQDLDDGQGRKIRLEPRS